MSIVTVLICTAVCVATPLRVVDGDTVEIGGEAIRLMDVDAPETFHSRCPAEHARGLEAKAALESILDGATITITRHGTDRYRRTLARIETPAGDVGQQLLAEGHAIPYRPGSEAHRQRAAWWCRQSK